MMIIGLCGLAGAGKDTIADHLVRDHGFVKVALADEIKRTAKRWYDFTDEQLWGPSEMRNAPDKRYLRYPNLLDQYATEKWLTPRFVLQFLGTEAGRMFYSNTWVDITIRTAKTLLGPTGYAYDPRRGLEPCIRLGPPGGVVIPDVRYMNEIEAIKAAGGLAVRVVRPGHGGLEGLAGQHSSETEQRRIDDEAFNGGVFNNILGLESLYGTVDHVLKKWRHQLGLA